MRIVNKTHWRTDQITKLVYRVAQDELDPGQLKRARIQIKYRRQEKYISGWCTYGTGRNPRVYMALFLPRKGAIDLPGLAHTIAHELAHSKGLKHRDMQNTRYGWIEGWRERYAYANNFPVEARPEKPAPTLDDKRQKKLAAAQKKVAEWTRKQKLATTTLKKWEKKVKRLARTIASASPTHQALAEPHHVPDASSSSSRDGLSV